MIAINYFAMPGLANDIEMAAQLWQTTVDDMHSRSRKRDTCDARFAVMWLRMTRYNYSTTEAGAIFNRDHATAMHAKQQVAKLADTDKEFKERFTHFKNAFNL
jgi:chromosomal replication initiation ATPase DnaA